MTTIAEHIDHAAENVRAANHVSHGSLDVSAAYAVVGNLAVLAMRLPQLLDHVRRSGVRADPAAHYDDRTGADISATLGAASDRLDESRYLAEALNDQLTTPTTTSATSADTSRRASDMNPRLAKLWTVQDLADFLGVPPKTIYGWRSHGYGPKGKKIGRYVRFDPADVEEWFDGLTDQVA